MDDTELEQAVCSKKFGKADLVDFKQIVTVMPHKGLHVGKRAFIAVKLAEEAIGREMR